jgi:hypothetical protein
MTCIYCGLTTDGGRNHQTMVACVEALTLEADRLRRDVRMRDSAEQKGTRVAAARVPVHQHPSAAYTAAPRTILLR